MNPTWAHFVAITFESTTAPWRLRFVFRRESESTDQEEREEGEERERRDG